MADVPRLGRNSIDQQREMFRLAERDYGLDRNAIAARADISVHTIKGWQNGSAMPAWALFALGDAGVPDHLLSLVSRPFQKSICTNGDADMDALAEIAAELDHIYSRARHPNSPGGVEIVPQERDPIQQIIDRLTAMARRGG